MQNGSHRGLAVERTHGIDRVTCIDHSVAILTHYATKASLCLDLFFQIIVFIARYSHVIIFRQHNIFKVEVAQRKALQAIKYTLCTAIWKHDTMHTDREQLQYMLFSFLIIDNAVRMPTLGWPSNILSSSEVRNAVVAMTAGYVHTLSAHMGAKTSTTSTQC